MKENYDHKSVWPMNNSCVNLYLTLLHLAYLLEVGVSLNIPPVRYSCSGNHLTSLSYTIHQEGIGHCYTHVTALET